MSTPNRITIYLPPQTAAVLNERAGTTPLRSRSATIAAITDRYAEMVRRSMPTLSENEWRCILDALQGIWLREPAASLGSVWVSVDDALELDHLDEKWGLPDRSLGQRIRAMPFASVVAIVDAVERYWASPFGSNDRAAMIALVGRINIAEE